MLLGLDGKNVLMVTAIMKKHSFGLRTGIEDGWLLWLSGFRWMAMPSVGKDTAV